MSGIILQQDKVECVHCKAKPNFDIPYVLVRWIKHSRPCKHESTYTCPECLAKDLYDMKCAVCGCEAEYT